MSKKNMWTILDVSEEARELAKRKAQLDGKKIGVWISDCILGKEENKPGNQDDQLHLVNVTLKSIFDEINEIKLGMTAVYNEMRQEKSGTKKHNFFGKFSR